MMRLGKADYYKHGDYNAICQTCLFKFKASELRKQWNGLYVCAECYEERHPQDSIQIRSERNNLPFRSPEPEITYVTVAEIDTTKL